MTATGLRQGRIGAVGAAIALAAVAVFAMEALLSPSAAHAAAPLVKATWVTEVHETSARLRSRIDPGGVTTTYRFQYIAAAARQANQSAGRDPFAGAAVAPAGAEGLVGKSAPAQVSQQLSGLAAETEYRYRVVARNADGTVEGPERTFATGGFGGPLVLLDDRAWELVSPPDKNGGEVEGFGGAHAGALQAAAQGDAATFSSATSFATGGQGAPVASQYVSLRSGAGWSTSNVTAPVLAAAQGEEPDAPPYGLFSADLSRGLLAAAAYPPLPGTEAPAGYANYYLRDSVGGFTPLLSQADVAGLSLPPTQFELAFAGSSQGLAHVVLSTCAALTPGAVEAPGPGGCDPASPNLYQWSAAGLRLLSLPPGETTGTAPARLAAAAGAVSDDGSRIYWTDGAALYLRDGNRTVQVDAAQGGGGEFQLATPSGAVALFTKGEHLFRYDLATETAVDLTPGGGVRGVLGASPDASYVYFATATALRVIHGGATTVVALAPDAVNYPPSTGAARLSADGTRLAFLSAATIGLYDNTDVATGEPDDEAYVYDASKRSLTCASCDPSGERPTGSARIPGAAVTGSGEGAVRAYKPRSFSADGHRLFFESPDSLVLQDVNSFPDVYEWEAAGSGTCAKPSGCLQLISGGSGGSASFVDASADGSDAFFLTGVSLVGADPGAVDLYDARVGGGFPEPPTPIPCEGDACQPLPSPPDDPSPGSLVPSTGNPPVHFPKAKKKRQGKGKKKRAHRRHTRKQKRKGKRGHGKRRHGRHR